MTLDGFLTFIGLLIASFAVLDATNQLKIRSTLIWQIPIGLCSFIIFLFFQLYFQLENIFYNNSSTIFDYFGFKNTTNNSLSENTVWSFFTIIGWVIIATILHFSARINYISLNKICQKLHDESRYYELIELASKNWDRIEQASKGKRYPQKILEWINKKLCNFGWYFPHVLIPSYTKDYDASNETKKLILGSDGVIRLLQTIRPDFALKLMSCSFDSGFRKKYIDGSINNSLSHYYKELEQICDFLVNDKDIPSNCIILHGLLNNPDKAIELDIWIPVGESVLQIIRDDTEYLSNINYQGEYVSKEQNDPILIATRFFDIMIRKAIYCETSDHMWLQYLQFMIEEIEKKYVHTDINADEEFQSFGAYVIWQITETQENWINEARFIPPENKHRNPQALNGKDFCSIPYWAAKSYIASLKIIFASSNLPQRFKVDRLQSFIYLLIYLNAPEDMGILRKNLIQGLIKEPHKVTNKDWISTLKGLCSKCDVVIMLQVEDFTDALESASKSLSTTTYQL